MRTVLLIALVSTFSWGIWTTFVKLASKTYTPFDIMVVQGVTSIALAVLYAAVSDGMVLPTITKDARYLIGVAIFGALAPLAYYFALDRGGSVAIVSTIESTYFVVAAVLGVLVLGEQLALTDAAAIFLVLIAVGLFAL